MSFFKNQTNNGKVMSTTILAHFDQTWCFFSNEKLQKNTRRVNYKKHREKLG